FPTRRSSDLVLLPRLPAGVGRAALRQPGRDRPDRQRARTARQPALAAVQEGRRDQPQERRRDLLRPGDRARGHPDGRRRRRHQEGGGVPVLIRLLVAAALVSALGTRAAAAQSPEEKLNEAKSLFRAGQYAEVIPILSGLLYPTSQLTAADDLVDAHLLLGIAHFQQGDRTFAEREIGEALALDRNLSITTESYSREAVEFFERKKEELEREEHEERDRLARARKKRRLAEVL